MEYFSKDQLKCDFEYFFKFQIFSDPILIAVLPLSWQLLGNAMYFTDRYTDVYIARNCPWGSPA